MALCDWLEAAQAKREATRDRLTAASLSRLNAPDPQTFAADARFALDALPAVTARSDQISRLRQTILNLAVRGKLLPQDPRDERAQELLKRITKEKTRLMKAGAIPHQKEAIPDPAKQVGPLPVSWFWIALGDVCNLVTSGSRGWGEFYATSGPGFIRAQNIRFGKLRINDLANSGFKRPRRCSTLQQPESCSIGSLSHRAGACAIAIDHVIQSKQTRAAAHRLWSESNAWYRPGGLRDGPESTRSGNSDAPANPDAISVIAKLPRPVYCALTFWFARSEKVDGSA